VVQPPHFRRLPNLRNARLSQRCKQVSSTSRPLAGLAAGRTAGLPAPLTLLPCAKWHTALRNDWWLEKSKYRWGAGARWAIFKLNSANFYKNVIPTFYQPTLIWNIDEIWPTLYNNRLPIFEPCCIFTFHFDVTADNVIPPVGSVEEGKSKIRHS
jgi:hypothetical protein